jgi:HEAT repeat protein
VSAQRTILDELRGADRRSIGRSNQVVGTVRRAPSLFPLLINGLEDEDPLVRMRAADAAEKLTVKNPQLLQPFKRRLINLAAQAEQQELRWHLAQMLPRLELSEKDRKSVATILRGYLKDKSRIVKTFAMQSLADLALQDSRLLASVTRHISAFVRKGSPAMKSRGRKLLLRLVASTVPHCASRPN